MGREWILDLFLHCWDPICSAELFWLPMQVQWVQQRPPKRSGLQNRTYKERLSQLGLFSPKKRRWGWLPTLSPLINVFALLYSLWLWKHHSPLHSVSWAEGFFSTVAWSKAGESLGTCIGCKWYVGNRCSSSCSTFALTIAQRLSNHCHCAQLLHQYYQSCFRKIQALTTLALIFQDLLSSAWRHPRLPSISLSPLSL